jgi:hypothetical protein
MSQFASLFKTNAKEKTKTKTKTKIEIKQTEKQSEASPPPIDKTTQKVKTEKRTAGKTSNPVYT